MGKNLEVFFKLVFCILVGLRSRVCLLTLESFGIFLFLVNRLVLGVVVYEDDFLIKSLL